MPESSSIATLRLFGQLRFPQRLWRHLQRRRCAGFQLEQGWTPVGAWWGSGELLNMVSLFSVCLQELAERVMKLVAGRAHDHPDMPRGDRERVARWRRRNWRDAVVLGRKMQARHFQ